jgi:hypothetical protein
MRATCDSHYETATVAEGVPGEALILMEKALALLDGNVGPEDAGAHLDLAIHRLRAWIQQDQLR